MPKLHRKRQLGPVPISVVIPTWNEEAWLPRLLDSLTQVGDLIDETIVVDNSSVDRTADIAKEYGCKVILGGKPGLARNRGAASSSGEIILFIDADAIISRDAIELAKSQFECSQVVSFHCRIRPITRDVFVRFCYSSMATYFKIMGLLGFPQGVGTFIAVRRRAFDQLGGFDEKIEAGEDLELFRRLGKIGIVKFSFRKTIAVSARRFSVEPPMAFALKCLFMSVLCICGLLATRVNIVKYNWQPYPRGLADLEDKLLGIDLLKR